MLRLVPYVSFRCHSTLPSGGRWNTSQNMGPVNLKV